LVDATQEDALTALRKTAVAKSRSVS